MSGPGITVAMLGARMHYAVPRILHAAGQLQALFTDAYLPDGLLRRAVAGADRSGAPGRRLRPLLGRHHPDLAGAPIHAQTRLALGRVLRPAGRSRPARRAFKRRAAQALADMIERQRDPGRGVYAVQGAALESLTVARGRGIGAFLEQSIAARGVAEAVLARECDDWAGWFGETGLPRFDPAATDRAQAEWDQADMILAASDFVRRSLLASGVAPDKIRVVPYGVDLPDVAARRDEFDGRRRLRVLFAGHADLRKGIHHLLRAVAALGPGAVELRVAGDIGLTPQIQARFAEQVQFLGRVPRQDMSALYRWADLLAVPSLIEGSATVSYEALAHGLPVIATENAGTLMRDGEQGRIVAAGAMTPIAEALALYRDRPDHLRAHATGARALRAEVSYARYATELMAALSDGAGR